MQRGISMKIKKIFLVFISIVLVLTGCGNGIKNVGNKVIVEKRIGELDNYQYCNEIKDNKEVQKVKDILDTTTWNNVEVNMAYPPDYAFHFEDTNGKASEAVYKLWISPNKDKVELVIDSVNRYVHLNEQVSSVLFKIITGKELGSV